MTHIPIELVEHLDMYLLTLFFLRAANVSSNFAGQTPLVIGFGNLAPRNGLVTEPHKSLLTSACWLKL